MFLRNIKNIKIIYKKYKGLDINFHAVPLNWHYNYADLFKFIKCSICFKDSIHLNNEFKIQI